MLVCGHCQKTFDHHHHLAIHCTGHVWTKSCPLCGPIEKENDFFDHAHIFHPDYCHWCMNKKSNHPFDCGKSTNSFPDWHWCSCKENESKLSDE